MNSMPASAISTIRKLLHITREIKMGLSLICAFLTEISQNRPYPIFATVFAHMKTSLFMVRPFQTDRQAGIDRRRTVCRLAIPLQFQSQQFADSRHKNKVFIPYLGASYDLNDNLTAYTSYTTIFRPQVRNLDRNGKPLEPQRGKTYELGLKASWFEGRLNASAAAFINKRDHWGRNSR